MVRFLNWYPSEKQFRIVSGGSVSLLETQVYLQVNFLSKSLGQGAVMNEWSFTCTLFLQQCFHCVEQKPDVPTNWCEGFLKTTQDMFASGCMSGQLQLPCYILWLSGSIACP